MISNIHRENSESQFTSEDTCRNLEGNNELDSEGGISVVIITDAQQSYYHQNIECLVLDNPKTSNSLEYNHCKSSLRASVPTVTGEISNSNPSLDTAECHSSFENNVKHNSDNGKLCVEAAISSRSVFTAGEETQLTELIPQQVTSPNVSLTRSLPGCERYKYKFIQ